NDDKVVNEKLLKQKHTTKNILVFHNSHMNRQQMKGSYKFALNHSEKVEKYLILTEKQKEDIFSQVPLDERQLSVIPHSIKTYKSLANENKLDRFVFIGRLGFQKQVD